MYVGGVHRCGVLDLPRAADAFAVDRNKSVSVPGANTGDACLDGPHPLSLVPLQGIAGEFCLMAPLAKDNTRSCALPLFLLAFACGLSQIFFPSKFGFGAGWETVAIARELARTGAFANPFQAGPSGATAVIAPLFPMYLAA